MTAASTWMPLSQSDLDSVNRIADNVHQSLPERPEVFEEKVRLFPQGCRRLVKDSKIVGYGISHPWLLNSIPPLDEFLGAIPLSPQCLYVHDVAVLQEARGEFAAARYIDYIKGVAKQMNIPSLALVSVYGTHVLWSRFGFQVVQPPDVDLKLNSYGATARYMVCNVQAQ